MTPSKITVPLFLGIAGTIGFNLSPKGARPGHDDEQLFHAIRGNQVLPFLLPIHTDSELF
jgi:hypothetical protein